MGGSREGGVPPAGTNAGAEGRATAGRALMKENAARLQLFEDANDLLCVAGLDGYFRLLNPAWRRTLGWEEHELIAHPWLDYVHVDDREATVEVTRALAQGHEANAFENRYRRRDGSYVSLSWSSRSDPATGLLLAVARPISEQRQADEELRKIRDEYRMLFEGMLDGFSYHEMIFDGAGKPVDYRFLAVNSAFEAQTGLRAEDVIGKRVLDVLPQTEPYWIESFGHVAKTGIPTRFEHYSSEFRKHFECVAFQPRPGQFACTFRDITARKEAEEGRAHEQAQFLQAQKMESLGVLTGGIAHDFNNILTAVVVGAERARASLAPAHPAIGDLDTIVEAAERLTDLCRQMLAYAGKSRPVVQPTDLSQLVRGMASLLQLSVSKKARLVFDLATGIPAAQVDATQVRQLVLNLVINASDAIGAGGQSDRGGRDGTLAVRTGSMHCGPAQLASSVMGTSDRLEEGEYVFIEVEDDGCGMAPATVSRIFDPFFTTKSTGRGLGLAATMGIVRGHRGTIQVRSEVAKGTVFRVLVPAVDLPATAAPEKALPEARRFEGVVLLADDEPLVRRVTERQLASIGFEVLVAADGVEALDVFAAHADRIGLVLLDMTMPRLGGAQVAEKLWAARPELPIIVFSGYSEEDTLARVVNRARCSFLAKPFTYAELEKRIIDALGN